MESAKRLRRKEAAAYFLRRWGVTVADTTLAKYATVGGGPDYQRFGRIPVYAEVDLDRWVNDRMGPKVSNSTEADARKGEAAHA